MPTVLCCPVICGPNLHERVINLDGAVVITSMVREATQGRLRKTRHCNRDSQGRKEVNRESCDNEEQASKVSLWARLTDLSLVEVRLDKVGYKGAKVFQEVQRSF